MTTRSIEWLHTKLDKSIQLVQSFTEIKGLDFIIKSCRLKPHKIIFQKGRKQYKYTRLFKHWIDEFGNSLVIVRRKQVNIIYNDLSLPQKSIVSTDLYYGLSLDRVARMSKLVYMVAGKDEDLYQDCCLLTFLGIDNHLRSYLYWYREWHQVSPLLMGMEKLQELAEYVESGRGGMVEKEDNSTVPCVNGKAWLDYLPASERLLEEIEKHCEWLLLIFDEG